MTSQKWVVYTKADRNKRGPLFMYDAEIMDADKNAVIEWKDVPGE